MPRPCTTCNRTDVAAIHGAIEAGESIRAVAMRFGIERSALQRHAKHALLDATAAGAADEADTSPGRHLGAAEALVAEVRERQGSDYSALDHAEAEYLLSVARLADANPTSIPVLKELRLTIAEFRKTGEASEPYNDEAEQLVARIRGAGMPPVAPARPHWAP